jgi:hypothetical protein
MPSSDGELASAEPPHEQRPERGEFYGGRAPRLNKGVRQSKFRAPQANDA